jgi:hypothetical protein
LIVSTTRRNIPEQNSRESSDIDSDFKGILAMPQDFGCDVVHTVHCSNQQRKAIDTMGAVNSDNIRASAVANTAKVIWQ